MVSLNNEQKNVLDQPPNTIVTGPAGTGKTLAAVHLAKKLAANNSVLFVTFTPTLAQACKE